MIITRSRLLENRSSTRSYSVTESLNEHRKDTKSGKVTIFLSHKHNELAELNSAVTFLKNHKTNIYVDWLDEGMPKTTSGDTAKRIKSKIEECQKFILLATEAAIESKWCNWELGFGDAKRFDRNIAIFPIKNDNTTFSGSEYLQIYPRIEYIERSSIQRRIGGYFEEGYYVITPADSQGTSTYTKIKDWLER